MTIKINADMIISEVLYMDRGTAPIFMAHGLHCIGCPSSSMDTIRDACEIHGLEEEDLIADLNDYFDQIAQGLEPTYKNYDEDEDDD